MFISAGIHKNEQFVGMVGMYDKHRNIMKHRMMNVFFRPFLKVFSLITFTRFFLFSLLPRLIFMPSLFSSFRRQVDFTIVPSQPRCRFRWTLHTLTGNQRRAISVASTTYILFIRRVHGSQISRRLARGHSKC